VFCVEIFKNCVFYFVNEPSNILYIYCIITIVLLLYYIKKSAHRRKYVKSAPNNLGARPAQLSALHIAVLLIVTLRARIQSSYSLLLVG